MVSNCAEASGPDEKPVTVTHEKSNSPLHTHTQQEVTHSLGEGIRESSRMDVNHYPSL